MTALKINDKNAVLETENAVKENFEQNENLKTNNTKAKIKGLKFTAETLLRQQKFLNEVKIQVAKNNLRTGLKLQNAIILKYRQRKLRANLRLLSLKNLFLMMVLTTAKFVLMEQ